MKKFFVCLTLLVLASTASADVPRKVYTVVTDPGEIASLLSILIPMAKNKLVTRDGDQTSFLALSLAGYRATKITFRDAFGDGKYCYAVVTLNNNDERFSTGFLDWDRKSSAQTYPYSHYCIK